MKKRFPALILLFALMLTLVFSLSSCKEKYEPVESTSEEKRTVIDISYDGEKYEVPYELYRAFFLQLKSSVDGGNGEVWTGAEKDSYIAKIDALIYQRISEIYAIFHLCEKADIDVYSKDFDEKIQELIEIAVEGGTIDGTFYEGFGGDYDKYLASLKEMNLNYSAQVLLLRYQLAYDALANYYIGDVYGENLSENSAPGKIQYAKEDVKAFYNSEDSSRRVIITILQDDYFTEKRAQEIRDTIASKTNETDVINYVFGFTVTSPESHIIGRYTHDEFYYSELTESAFSLEVGKTSSVITLKTDTFDGYAILYRQNATEEFFNSNYNGILNSYLYNEMGKIIKNTKTAIADAISPTDILNQLDRSTVTMGE